jgi:hypothetical protein
VYTATEYPADYDMVMMGTNAPSGSHVVLGKGWVSGYVNYNLNYNLQVDLDLAQPAQDAWYGDYKLRGKNGVLWNTIPAFSHSRSEGSSLQHRGKGWVGGATNGSAINTTFTSAH